MSFKTAQLLPEQSVSLAFASPLAFSCGNLTSPVQISLQISGQSYKIPIILTATNPIYNFPVVPGQVIESFTLTHSSKNGTVSILYYSLPDATVDTTVVEVSKRKQPTPAPVDVDDVAPPSEKKAKIAPLTAEEEAMEAERMEKINEKAAKAEKAAERAAERAEKKAIYDKQVAEIKVHQVMKLPNGLQYQDQEIGKGKQVTKGAAVSIRYQGMFTSGQVFDSNMPKGQLLTFTLGAGEVVAGMEQGIIGMTVGGKRRLIIPSPLGYGKAGAPPTIPPNSTLIFDVQLFKASGGR